METICVRSDEIDKKECLGKKAKHDATLNEHTNIILWNEFPCARHSAEPGFECGYSSGIVYALEALHFLFGRGSA